MMVIRKMMVVMLNSGSETFVCQLCWAVPWCRFFDGGVIFCCCGGLFFGGWGAVAGCWVPYLGGKAAAQISAGHRRRCQTLINLYAITIIVMIS